MEIIVTKLEDEHLQGAAGLVAENFRALRLAHPLLPRCYEDPARNPGDAAGDWEIPGAVQPRWRAGGWWAS